MAHNDEQIPPDTAERTGWSGDEVVYDQDRHRRQAERTGWSGDEVVNDQGAAHPPRSD